MKCPFNLDNPYMDPFYTLPEMYIPQLTSQMFAFNSEFGILATKTDSVIFKRLTNNKETVPEMVAVPLEHLDCQRNLSLVHPRMRRCY